MTYRSLPVHSREDALRALAYVGEIATALELDERARARLGAASAQLAQSLLASGGGSLRYALEMQALAVTPHPERAEQWPDDGLQRALACAGVPRSEGLSVRFPLPAPPQRPELPEPSTIAPDPLELLTERSCLLSDLLEQADKHRSELDQVRAELEETNRGVVALYAELDERAHYLQRTTEVKSRFLSNMTHEFRTPLNSVLSLSEILLQRLDGPLTTEQEKQISFIRQAAQGLSELVNDLLDLAKVEAGKVTVRPVEFTVEELFAALRGMLRPLLDDGRELELVFEAHENLPSLYSDEAKVSQILRNFISNAIKYTERGEIKVQAELRAGDTIVFSVSDTGIGISHEDQARIFEEFTQVENPLQHRLKGTGLGLPLSRKLAQLLGGNIGVSSQLGKGSVFYVALPLRHETAETTPDRPEISRLDPGRTPVLVVEDSPEWLFIYEHYLQDSSYQMLSARTVADARRWMESVRPAAIILDVLLAAENTWDFLAELRTSPRSAGVPVIVSTVVNNEPRARELGASAFHLKPAPQEWLLTTLDTLVENQDRLLVIDDDEISRYLLRDLLADTPFSIIEAASGSEGLGVARELRPRAIFLDLLMPDMDGFTVFEALKADPELQNVPVVVYTSRPVSKDERQRLAAAAAILSKDSRSRENARQMVRQALLDTGLVVEE